MAHMVETMAYAGELPWHGLGVKVIDDLTPEQIMKKAGVDWEVEKQDLVTTAGSIVKSIVDPSKESGLNDVIVIYPFE